MTFDYLERVVVDAQLDVENIGQCAILGRNDLGEESYLIIRTELGFTEVIEYGPVVPDLTILPFAVSMMYNRFEYNEGKIEKIIDKFLNNPRKFITQAEVVSIEDIHPLIMSSMNKVLPNTREEGLFGDERHSDNS